MENIKLNLKNKSVNECVGVFMNYSNYQNLLTNNALLEKKIREQTALIDKLKT